MQFGWQPQDMSLFHATDDRMLSHIGGALSRQAKRSKYKKEHDDDETKRRASKGWVSRKSRRQKLLVNLPQNEQHIFFFPLG